VTSWRREIVVDRWFGWRDHSWGVRPSVGGFEPPSPGVKDAFPSAARTGGKGMLLFYIGFNVGDELGGGIQIIENGLGDRIYLTGHFGTPDAQSRVVECESWSVETFPGTRMPSRLSVRARTDDGQVWDIVAEPTRGLTRVSVTMPVTMTATGRGCGAAPGSRWSRTVSISPIPKK